MPPLLLTVPEAAALAAVSRSQAYSLVRARIWPSVVVGSTLKVPFHDLKAWIAAHTVGPRGDTWIHDTDEEGGLPDLPALLPEGPETDRFMGSGRRACTPIRKWLAMSLEQRGAWITLMTIASNLQPRWRFESRDHAVLILRRDGALAPEKLVDDLINLRLFDEVTGEEVVVHDYQDWQRYPSDTPEARTERSRRSRSRHRGDPSSEGRATTRNEEERETSGQQRAGNELKRQEEKKKRYGMNETYEPDPAVERGPSEGQTVLAPTMLARPP